MIPVNQPLLDGNEGRYLQECISTGWISSGGFYIPSGLALTLEQINDVAAAVREEIGNAPINETDLI